MSMFQRAKDALLGTDSSGPTTQPPASDIDMQVFGTLMEQLAGDATPDERTVAALWPRAGARGQELILKDATMGPKLRALGLEATATATLDQVDAQVAEPEETGWLDGWADTAGDLLGGGLGSDWNPLEHPILQGMQQQGEEMWEAGAEWAEWAGLTADNKNKDTERAEDQAPPAAPVDVGPHVVLRPGAFMYADRSFRDRTTIQEPIAVEVVETVQEGKEIATSGAREAGFIDKYHVRSTDSDGPAIDHWVGFGALTLDSELSEDFVAADQIPLDQVSRRDRGVAQIWNEKGSFIDRSRGDIDRAVAVAVMKAESGGMGFSGAGDMVIRFENHKFRRTGEGISKSWGQDNREVFDNHFRPAAGATEHEFNKQGADAGGEWTRFHGSQTMEWEALQLAIDISGDPEAAYCAISMGAGQVMGFNALKLGYGSAAEMFEAMRSDAEANVGGIFSFIAANPEAKAALAADDYVAFAAQYNGQRYAHDYGKVIGDGVERFRRLEATFLQADT